MFTGIIRNTGTMIAHNGSALEIGVEVAFAATLAPGDSLAVNGVCLTIVAEANDGHIRVDLSQETLLRTSLRDLRPGTIVNLEPAMRVSDRLDGHLVLGHVDATGRVRTLHRIADNWRLVVQYPVEYASLIVDKGSIAVDGISLTPYAVTQSQFECAVIPTTHASTNLSALSPGSLVNLEFDILAKYVKEHLGYVYRR